VRQLHALLQSLGSARSQQAAGYVVHPL
jgi:hypothetical protein